MHRVLMLVVLLLAAGASSARATEPVRVAILDSGIDATHSEFRPGQIVAWRDWINDGPTAYDDLWHGTAVASVVAGQTVGVHPGAELLVAKVLDDQNALRSWSHLTQAIEWAVANDADVINVSIWSFAPQPTNSLTVGRSIQAARDAGALVVWIAGNGAETAPGYPSPYTASTLVGGSSPQALVVGSADAAGRRSTFSQRDPEMLAHGEHVPLAVPGGGFGIGSGTSFAAPWVAGAAAKLLDEGAPHDPDWLEWVLLHSARDDQNVSYLDEGYGFLGDAELEAAVAVARGDAPVPDLDERDVWHAITTAPRTAQTATLPAGVLPPG